MQPIRQDLLSIFQQAITELFGEAAVIKYSMIQRAGRPEFGDYQANFAMSLGKQLGENPKALADRVIQALAGTQWDGVAIFAKLENAGPGFINITLSPEYVLRQLSSFKPEHYSGHPEEQGKVVVVDYGGANIAKEMHVGHLRSTVIGDAIVRILSFVGYKVVRQSHLGDWGTQFGMLIEFMIENKIIAHDLTEMPDLTALYQKAKVAFDADPDFAVRARERVVKLQSGETETLAIWQHLVDISVQYFETIYQRLDVLLRRQDDCGESFYNSMLPGIVDELVQAGIAEKSEGAWVIFLEGYEDRDKKPLPMIIQKSDGGYLYSTTDLAAVKYRMNHYQADRLIYVTDSRQEQHFNMVLGAIKRTNWAKKTVQFEHMPFGSVLGKDKKPFKTRSGESIRLSLLLDEAEERAYRIVNEKNPSAPEAEKKQIAHTIGIGALKYADLTSERTKDYVFDWDTLMSFEGNTAPYLQNAYVRIQSIFRRGEIDVSKYTLSKINNASRIGITTEVGEFTRVRRDGFPGIMITEPIEHELAIHLLEFHEVIARVVDDLMIHKLCTYLHQLAAQFHRFYEHCKILNAPDAHTKESRLVYCVLVAETLKKGLNLLGVDVLEKM